MQQEFNGVIMRDQAYIGDSAKTERIREIARTALIIVLVCSIMPFMSYSYGDIQGDFSLYQVATAFQKTDVAKELPNEMDALVTMAKAEAWAVLLIAALGAGMLISPRRDLPIKWVMIISAVGMVLTIWLYYFIRIIFAYYLPDLDIDFVLNPGGVVTITGFLLAALIILTTRMHKRTLMAALLILFVIPATIAFGILFLDDRKYYFISLMIIVETMLPFFMIFENRKPEAREMVVIAVLAAIAVAGRAAFFMLPHFKPVTAIVIIAGVCLGPEAGFLTGALAGFVSNFFFGQGPWSPWQMFSFGIIGFLAGILFKKGWLKKKRSSLCIYGGFAALVIYGLLMDTCSLFMWTPVTSWAQALAIYASGFPVNVVHGSATVFFLYILSQPMIEKIDRIKVKYGMMEP